jgi:zinc protease
MRTLGKNRPGMNVRTLRFFAAMLTLAVSAGFAVPGRVAAANLTVTRATLSNGLRVIVVHNPLAPVVTAEMNYKVGSDDQPTDGLAHATEHMMFRGSKTLSSSALVNTMDITGGDYDADTQNTVTQYYFTVPSQYLDLALHAERSRATGLLMSESQWKEERLAITQEVTQDNSNAIYRLFTKMQTRMLAGTPYAKNGLGTVFGFAHVVNSTNLLKFYNTWYHPNNAVYVIVGDVDGPATIAKVRQLFGDVPAVPVPKRAPVKLEPLKAVVYHDESDEAFTAVLLGYRLPGFDSPDYSAAQILGDVLNSQRGNLYALAASGKAYGSEFDVVPYPATSIGVALLAVPVSTKPEDADALLRGVIDNYRKNGVPADLVAAAKLREVSQLEFAGNSIEGLASQWSEAVAIEGLASPDDAIAAFEKVTTADVNRVLRTYFDENKVVAAYAVPKSAGAASAGGALAKEVNNLAPSEHAALPSWAQNVLKSLRVPRQTLSPTSTMLSNGIRLIVQPESITHTVVVTGDIANNPQVQEPAGKDGVADVTAALLPYGTTTYGRIALQAQLDKIAATTQAGTTFSLQVLSRDFDRGVGLLADEELHPAFDASAFAIVQPQEVKGIADAETAPDHLTDVALANALYPPGDVERRFATVKTADSITLGDVKAWYAAAYRPDLTTIVVVGEVTPAQARATFEKYFGAWKTQGPKPHVYPGPVASNAPSSTVVPATGRVQSQTQLVETIGLLRRNPDWANLEVANTALSGGFSSLLYGDLREVHGYVYYVSSAVNAGKVRSTFNVNYASDPKNIVPAETATLAILRMLQQKPIDADRLLRAKAQLMGDVPLRQASYNGVGNSLLTYAIRGLPLNQNLIDATRELHATQASVKAAMAKWIRVNGFVRVVTGPGPK